VRERDLLVAVLGAVVAAVAAVAVPWWVAVVAVIAALAVRRAPVVVLAVVVGVSCLSARAEAGLALPAVTRVEGWATLVADPEPEPGGLSIEVSIAGRRFRSFVDADRARPLRTLLAGERFEVVGTVGVLRGNVQWIASRHLSGRLRMSSIGRTSAGAWWWQAAGAVRRTVDRGLASFDDEERSLFSGVVFGDDRGQPPLTRHRFRASGLAHLLAVSGQNVAFVLVAASPLTSRLALRTRWIVTLVLLLAFATVTRFEPSVLRATAMAVVAATASMSGRYATGIRVVAVAILGLLVVDPLLVWSGGFRLSVAASVALVVLARPIERRLRGPRWLVEPIAVSLAAQIGTAPLIVAAFGTVPLLAPLANLLAVPVAGWLMVWGVVTGPIAGAVGEPVAAWLGHPSRALIWWIDHVATVAAHAGLPSVGGVGVAGLVVLVAAILVPSAVWRTVAASAAVAAIVVDLVLLAPAGHLAPSAGVDLYVGGEGGDAVVLVLGATATDDGVLDSVTRGRIDHVDLVVVPGSARRVSTTVHLLRSAIEVRRVVAADPSQIRDAAQLEAGDLEVGPLAFVVTAGPRGFAVRGPV
jgi:competence protein ComEC